MASLKVNLDPDGTKAISLDLLVQLAIRRLRNLGDDPKLIAEFEKVRKDVWDDEPGPETRPA